MDAVGEAIALERNEEVGSLNKATDRDSGMQIRIRELRRIVESLAASGVACSLGGSGLLYALGLGGEPRDWDLMTDAPREFALQAFRNAGWRFREMPGPQDRFATAYRFALPEAGADLLGRFAIRSDPGICRLTAEPSGQWQGIPLASPEVWAVAYALMDKPSKSARLLDFLFTHGGSMRFLRELQAGPLPSALRDALRGLEARP